jgi:hypothetical protein
MAGHPSYDECHALPWIEGTANEMLARSLSPHVHCHVMSQARDKFLKPGGLMFPSCGTIFVTPITCEALYQEQVRTRLYFTLTLAALAIARRVHTVQPRIDSDCRSACQRSATASTTTSTTACTYRIRAHASAHAPALGLYAIALGANTLTHTHHAHTLLLPLAAGQGLLLEQPRLPRR